ncbi:MAG: restriction endonuclease [Clostridia bacterium]|nr:restriction endonuclease [Clostridia bacterium]
MRITNKMRKKALASVVSYLNEVGTATRNQIIDGALIHYGLTKKELDDFSPKSKNTIIRSYIGTALNDLMNKKDIKRLGDSYSLAKEELVIIREDECETKIKEILELGSYVKEEIFQRLEKYFGTGATLSFKDDYNLRSIAGNVLFNLVDSGEIELVGGKYSSKASSDYEIYDTPLPENEFKPKFFKALWLMGGKFFESFVANLLEKYYTLSGQMVVYCDITGGSDDGGIDIILETVDYLGFGEKIVSQTKCRDTAHVTEKEVREFYGAMNAVGATRGIYVTTTHFHTSAEYFLDSVSDLVGVDGEKLFELVKKTRYGIKKCEGGYTFDTAIFTR